MSAQTRMTRKEWVAEGERRFGLNRKHWAFVCPCCKTVTRAHEWEAAGAPEGAVAFSCIGRWTGAKREAFGKGKGPCNYAGGGLLGLNPVEINDEVAKKTHAVFAFAEPVTYRTGMNLMKLSESEIHDIISDLSPNRRWYCGTLGSYKRAAELRLPRSAMPKLLSWCWNRVAWLSSLRRKEKARVEAPRGHQAYEHACEIYEHICEMVYETLPGECWWRYPKSWGDV